ncbi:MAG: DUF4177 domain-containing protein [Anaerolineales bacterium]|nr:DUF4177 domain-containing protein [Anaerolineales bacterium]MCX7756025.1 DUF4177 domain-containing protein [Anaerolineales bacterium]MDW8277033.1 DUF4177 domain-containing protein [Anaerolineales bacterium]
MPQEMPLWEYRVQTFGSFWHGVKAEELQALLNEWGEQGWEVIAIHEVEGHSKINIIAKRPLTDRVRRMRSMPAAYQR